MLYRADLCAKEIEADGTVYLSCYVNDPTAQLGYHKIEGAEAAYWRKANQIHRWFVTNVQHGEDDCGYYPVSPLQLRELIALCRQVKEHPEDGPILLPTQSGFFFGGTDYDDDYFYDLDQTIERLERALAEAPEHAEFVYHSSW